MAAVFARRLTFENDLRTLWDPIFERMDRGILVLDGILEVTQMRVDAERVFTESLQHIIQRFNEIEALIPETESLRTHGLAALCVDAKNEYAQRIAFMESIRDDVRKPLIQMITSLEQRDVSREEMKENVQRVQDQQREFSEIKGKYDRMMNSEQKYKTPSDQLWYIKKQFDRQQTKWNRYHSEFQGTMTRSLSKLESMELQRMEALQVALTNWSAFISNYHRNRSYDIRHLTHDMAEIDPDRDLQAFMQCVLTEQSCVPDAVPNPRYRRRMSVFSAATGEATENDRVENKSNKSWFNSGRFRWR